MKERFFHIEFFREGDDYIAIEYNNRPAGGFTIDVYNFVIPWTFTEAMRRLSQEKSSQRQVNLTIVWLLLAVQMLYVYSEEDLLDKYNHSSRVKKKSCQPPLRNFKGLPVCDPSQQNNGSND